jgi:ribosomal protein L9
MKHDFKIEFEKGHVLLPEWKHIKTTGEHIVKIHLGEDVYIRLNVVVNSKPVK